MSNCKFGRENHAAMHYGAVHLVQCGGSWRCGIVCECNELSGLLEGTVYLQNRAKNWSSDWPTPTSPLRTDKVGLTAPLSHLLMELCILTPDWVTTNPWLWFRVWQKGNFSVWRSPPPPQQPLCSSALHCLVPWLCCTLYLHSLKTNKEKIERIRGKFLFFPCI